MKFCKVVYLLSVLLSVSAQGQEIRTLEYAIIENKAEIGKMIVSRIASASKTEYVLTSEARKRIIVLIDLYEKHTQTSINNVVRYASAYRSVNGKQKLSKNIRFTDSTCVVKNDNVEKTYRIKPPVHSVLSIYFSEPENIKEVYSDNKERMLSIQKVNNRMYKLLMPDSDKAFYYYNEKGLCVKEVVDKDLYKLEFVLRKIR